MSFDCISKSTHIYARNLDQDSTKEVISHENFLFGANFTGANVPPISTLKNTLIVVRFVEFSNPQKAIGPFGTKMYQGS